MIIMMIIILKIMIVTRSIFAVGMRDDALNNIVMMVVVMVSNFDDGDGDGIKT